MRKIFGQMLMSLVMGICFVIGIAVAIFLIEGSLVPPYDDHTWINEPEGVTVVDHRPDSAAPDLTIIGAIRNESAHLWDTINLEVNVFAGEALVNSCNGSVQEIPPGSDRSFRIRCLQASGQNLPDNVHYRVHVRSGFRVEQETGIR